MRAAPSIDPDAFDRPTAPPPDGLFALDDLGDHLATPSDVPTADDEFGRVFESGVLPRGSLSAPRVPSFGDDEPSGLRAAVAPSQPVIEKTRDELLEEMVAEIGLTSRPRRSVDNAELQRMSLDHRGGFLMSCVDGRSTVEEILDIAGMDPFDALQILVRLKRRGAIVLLRRHARHARRRSTRPSAPARLRLARPRGRSSPGASFRVAASSKRRSPLS